MSYQQESAREQEKKRSNAVQNTLFCTPSSPSERAGRIRDVGAGLVTCVAQPPFVSAAPGPPGSLLPLSSPPAASLGGGTGVHTLEISLLTSSRLRTCVRACVRAPACMPRCMLLSLPYDEIWMERNIRDRGVYIPYNKNRHGPVGYPRNTFQRPEGTDLGLRLGGGFAVRLFLGFRSGDVRCKSLIRKSGSELRKVAAMGSRPVEDLIWGMEGKDRERQRERERGVTVCPSPYRADEQPDVAPRNLT